eukprot:361800-Chlamydomonas_euryale.AAC.3
MGKIRAMLCSSAGRFILCYPGPDSDASHACIRSQTEEGANVCACACALRLQDDSLRCSRLTPAAGRPSGQKPSNNYAEAASSNMLAAEQHPSQLQQHMNQQAHMQQHQQGAAHMVRAGSTTDTYAQGSGSKPPGGHLRFETGTRGVDMSSSSLSSMTMMQGGMPGTSHSFMPMHGVPAGPICFGDAPYSMYSHPMQWIAADPSWQASGFSNAFQNDLKWDAGGGMQGQALDMAGMDGKPVALQSGTGLPELSFPPFFPCPSTRGDGAEASGVLHPGLAMTMSNSQAAAESDSSGKGAGATPPQFNPRFAQGGSTGSTGEDDDSLLLRLINSSGENGSRLVSVSPQQQQEATRQPAKQ